MTSAVASSSSAKDDQRGGFARWAGLVGKVGDVADLDVWRMCRCGVDVGAGCGSEVCVVDSG